MAQTLSVKKYNTRINQLKIPEMEHVYLFLIIISFAVTLTAIPIIILSYAKNKAEYLKPYLAVFIIISWNFLRMLVFDYLELMFNVKASFTDFPYNLMSIPEPFLAIFIPSFIHKLFSLKNRKPDYFFFCLCFLSILFFFMANFFGVGAEFLESFFPLLFLGLMSYSLIFTTIKFKHGKNKSLTLVWLCFSAVLVLFSIAGQFSRLTLLADNLENSTLYICFYLVFYISSIIFSLINIFIFSVSLKSFNKYATLISTDYMKAHSISKREQEIIQLVLAGKNNKVIAEELYISIPTVKSHLYNIFRKLQVSSRFELMRKLMESHSCDS